MQNKELCLSVEAIANEKRISQDAVFLALEEALALACEKRTGYNIRMSINRNNGQFETFRRWLVVDDSVIFVDQDEEIEFNEQLHIRHKQANGVEIDDFIEDKIQDIELGRIAAQIVKQVIIQKVRESERERIVSEYKERIGQTINVIVKRTDRGAIYVELDGMDGIVPKSESIPNELVRKGDRIKVYIKEVKSSPRGVQIILSRSVNEILSALLEMEVPEVSEGIIEIMGVARDPGLRAKVALRTRDKRIDPIGSCIGMRGSRIQAVSDGINGERVDVILWDSDVVQFVINAMAPATVISIMVDEDQHMMEVAVEDDQLAQAIGRNGQNIRLASEVTGWRLNVMSQSELLEKQKNQEQEQENKLSQCLDIDIDVATVLVQAGLYALDDIADATEEQIASIEGFDIDIAKALKERVQDELLAQALDDSDSAEILSAIEGVDSALVDVLIKAEILTQDDLAELSIDELIDIHEMSREKASEIILSARAPWFE